MQQFTIPQFIDVEDKIFGPITTRQFVIMLGGFLLMFIFYKIFMFMTFLILSIIVFIITGTFAFVRINGRPFHFFMLNFVQTVRRPALRVWNNVFAGPLEVVELEIVQHEVIPQARHYSSSRLAELSLMVDTRGEFKGRTDENEEVRTPAATRHAIADKADISAT